MFGDLVWTLEQDVLHLTGYPAPSDGAYLSAYICMAAGALVMVRTRRAGRDLTALLDAAIIATGAAVLASVFVIAPLASDSQLSLVAKVVSSAYPVGDLLLLAMLARMWAAPGARTGSYRLLAGSLGLVLAADVAWNISVIVSGDTGVVGIGRWIDAAWLGGYVLACAAACVPSMKTLADPAPDREQGTPSRRRLVVLACGLMLPAATLLIDGGTGGGVLWPVIGVGALLISGLVLVRMAGILTIVEVQAVQLAALARSDALTGAPNRRTWDHELSRACANSREQITPLCIAMIDMDHFKVYNDTHGHQAGDRLLREAVAAWTEQLGADAMIARYGGEEFAVLLPGVTVQEALARVRGMRPVTPDGQTFSAGVTAWDPQTEPGTAVAQADAALYQAKRTGRDRVLAHGYVLSGSDGGAALPPFTMVMQPIVDIATGAVVGHEALARFTDAAAGAGTDAAGAFRRAHADGHGDMLEAAAVTAALAVPDRPDDYDLYVNASAAALLSDRFWAELPTRLDGVVVELTEDQEHIDAVSLAGAVNRLRSRGGRIALDDLGAGVGEFSRLAALRPDVVKADRSLVHGCATHPGRSAVLRALVAYADDLGATVCAEGVEDAADLHHLAVLGVALAQGYLLSRPSPPWPTIAGCISAGAVAS